MRLNERHRRDLRASGLNDETITKSGIYSARRDEIAALVGVTADWLNSDGFLIPYLSFDGTIIQKRPRLDNPPIGKDGKPCKYLTAKGSPNRIYFPYQLIMRKEIFSDTSCSLIITEGEKKALKACQEGLNCISLAGVWCFRGMNGATKGPIPDLDLIRWKDRTVFIIFDSDVSQKPEVQVAQTALTQELEKRGASVRVILLPDGPNGEKVGLDDHLMHNSTEDLFRLEQGYQNKSSRLNIQDVADLLDQDIPPRDVLIDPILAKEEFTIISGPMKLGKSLIVQQLAMCIASGGSFIGMPVKKGKVLLIQQEMSLSGLKSRIEKMSTVFPKDLYRGRFYHLTDRGLKIDNDEVPPWLREAIEKVKPDLVILDPLYTLHSKDENRAQDMTKIMRVFHKIIKEYRVALLVVHHHGKKGLSEREGGEKHRGSSVIGGATDNNWMLDRLDRGYEVKEKKTSYSKLSFELRNAEAPDPLTLFRDSETLICTEATDLAEIRKVPTHQLVELVRAVGGRMLNSHLVKTIIEHFRVSHNTAREAILTALKENMLCRGQNEANSYWLGLTSLTTHTKREVTTGKTGTTGKTEEDVVGEIS